MISAAELRRTQAESAGLHRGSARTVAESATVRRGVRADLSAESAAESGAESICDPMSLSLGLYLVWFSYNPDFNITELKSPNYDVIHRIMTSRLG